MKILHIISSLEIGGAQRLLSDFLPLLSHGHEVTLLVNKEIDNDFSSRIKDAGITIITSILPIYSLKNIFFVRRIIKNYDVIHVHLFPTIYWAAFASIFKHIPMVYTEHSTSNKRRGKWYLRPIEQFVYSRYRRIISISEQTQYALTNWLGAATTDLRFTVVHNGINLSAFKPATHSKYQPDTLIMVSRFEVSKDQDTVLRAMQLLPTTLHLLLIGDGSRLETCKALCNSLKIQGRVHFLGARDDIATLLTNADIAIQSSHWEGFGLAAVEAMAAGLPVIASDVDGLRQVVEGAGLLFPKGDAEALSKLVKLLHSDNHTYKIIAEKCQHRSQQYDIQETTNKYITIYEEVTNNKNNKN
ncbi:MAG: glycosyltransferase [Prevotella sp.]|nr:glycosyltransferase [Prevotella sp.]